MPAFRNMTNSRSADVVVVGGGTVGAWTAVLLAESGVKHVVLLEAATLGDGASIRAAGMVRAQGGTETAIRLGLATQQFYAASGDRFPLDCGFRAQGYLMPCFTDVEVQQAHDRITLQRRLGLEVEWLSGADIDERRTGIAPGATLGASYAPGDGYIDAPRNVLAYTVALIAHRVDVSERRTGRGESDAVASLRRAVEVADGQGASWLALRALHSLACRYPDHALREQLGDLLETIPSGHDLPAFRAATGLLNDSG